jgi:hypothetical protein
MHTAAPAMATKGPCVPTNAATGKHTPVMPDTSVPHLSGAGPGQCNLARMGCSLSMLSCVMGGRRSITLSRTHQPPALPPRATASTAPARAAATAASGVHNQMLPAGSYIHICSSGWWGGVTCNDSLVFPTCCAGWPVLCQHQPHSLGTLACQVCRCGVHKCRQLSASTLRSRR